MVAYGSATNLSDFLYWSDDCDTPKVTTYNTQTIL